MSDQSVESRLDRIEKDIRHIKDVIDKNEKAIERNAEQANAALKKVFEALERIEKGSR
ncbi:hypothetical protein [Caulobacter sp.]|jgi:hypothetical protein|uniref:hypothetical protein n=1 Tax=Caulobacter sp. TaxID=78 RepID=UPI0031DCF7E0